MPTVITIVLPLIAIVLFIIAWRIIAGEQRFNNFWARFWARTMNAKNTILAILVTTAIVISGYLANVEFDEYKKGKLRLEYISKSLLLRDWLEKRNVPSANVFPFFGTRAEKEAAKHESRERLSYCTKQGKEIIIELNSKNSTPDLGGTYDSMLVAEVCKNWMNLPTTRN